MPLRDLPLKTFETRADESHMTATNIVLLVLGLGTCARGVYALATQDIEEERANGRAGGGTPRSHPGGDRAGYRVARHL